MKEKLTRRSNATEALHHGKVVDVPIEWDEANKAWVIVLILDEVRIIFIQCICVTDVCLVLGIEEKGARRRR
jgi:hypothetical protein